MELFDLKPRSVRVIKQGLIFGEKTNPRGFFFVFFFEKYFSKLSSGICV